MSIYGALYSSVSGIRAQGSAIGIISDNVSNINTVGYKAGSQYFGTLVTDSGSTVGYSPGGVRTTNRQLVSQQGLLQTTSSPTDIAISGGGMIVVSSGTGGPDAEDDTLYTRAGSFKTDASGNFVNASGLYLLGWPLDANGNRPGEGDNTNTELFTELTSLEVVNLGNASGAASATTSVTLGANLNATQAVFKGPGDTLKPGSDTTNTENDSVKSNEILVPNANLTFGDSFDITVPIDGTDTTYNFVYGGFSQSEDLTAGILGADSEGDVFTGATAGDYFTITNDDGDVFTFEYITTGNAKASEGTFKTPQDLVDAINEAEGLTARIATDGGSALKILVSAIDAREGLTFTNGTGTFVGATGGTTNLFDTDEVQITSTSNRRWNTLDGLSYLINQETDGITSILKNPTTTNASIEIYNDDPLTDIVFANTGTSEFIEEFGMTVTGTAGGENISTITQTYDPAVASSDSMSAGNITPHFNRGVTVYDSLGTPHTINIAYLKVGANKWSVEIYAANADDFETTPESSRFIQTGIVEFNGDGTLRSVDDALVDPIDISWTNESDASSISFDFGAIDTGDGLRQYASNSSLTFLTQNGSSIGQLDSVSIDENGFVIANFNNGQSQKVFKLPIAKFDNPDGLIRKANNAYIQSIASGPFNLQEAGDKVGVFASSSLESSNAELSEELTDMIVAQRAYQASAKVITTANQLLDDLNRITG